MKSKVLLLSVGLFLLSQGFVLAQDNNAQKDMNMKAEVDMGKGMNMDAGMDMDQQAEPGQMDMKGAEGNIDYYTCGMHPSVKVSPEQYNKGDTQCPICGMNLVPVKKQDSKKKVISANVISRVNIMANQLKLAGVETEPVKKRMLFKEIRTVGTVAYDPGLAIAQDEFISSMRSYEKAKQGSNQEIIDRAGSLVASSKTKLLLLGLGKDQIEQLAKDKKVQDNLILSQDKMWIYGDVYEYELPWIKVGSDIVAKPIGMGGEEYKGKIASINPVVDPKTRSVRFRALINNPDEKLKPEMYVDVQILSHYTDASGNMNVPSIPKTALLDTGRRKIVWVDKGNGDFEGRKVEVGPEAVDNLDSEIRYYPVIKGLKENEMVVTKGNFLIDSQSQITGVASSAYGGALSEKENKGMPGMPGMPGM